MVGLQALEGKDVKDLLSNVGSGGGAAAPAAGGAAAAGGEAEEAKEEAKEEGECRFFSATLGSERDWYRYSGGWLTNCYREGGVGRRHGFRSLRLSWLRLGQGVFLTPRIPFVMPGLAWICGGISHIRPQEWRL